jgi:hypothetical protein
VTASAWALDHLVVAARSLGEGVDWCEATLGITPGPGGRHPLMGTHNRLFSIASAAFPRAYFEIIAIDPDAGAPGRARWFDLDQPALQAALAAGPALIHWAARCAALQAELAALQAAGIERGEALAAERPTPRGLLRWRISVRPDGARLADGALPTLIEWGEVHPADTMPDSGVVLDSVALAGLPAAARSRLPPGVRVAAEAHAEPIVAVLRTPRGLVSLPSLRRPS